MHHPRYPRKALFATAALALAVATSRPASGQEQEVRLQGLRLGDHWYGPEVDHADLRGKVVLVEYWGS